MATLLDKLSALGGEGKADAREWRIRVRLNWHSKAKSAIRHMLTGARKLSIEEAKQIEAAHLKHCAEKIGEQREETRRLFDSMRRSIEAMQASDPEFFERDIEAVRAMLVQCGHVPGATLNKD